ncbi:Na+/H+ antiporter subunit E [Tomitella cavernea]|uniref:Na+/H+ antiporter subunit E n=1 Tax=Tomitella cavernea TaxID=1387982 RepID=A0ABP9CYL3_9ACTN|nr:Na+/H+ antiporter subunit E [Tomitella cavernea]
MTAFAQSLARRMRTPLTVRDVLIRLWVISWLTFVWVLLWGEVTAANVVGGLAVSLAILILAPLPQLPVEGRLHPLSAILLVLRVAFDLVVSSVEVAWLSVRPGPPPMTAILRAHVSVRSDLVLGLLVDAINVVPGTIVLEVDRRARVLYIHVLDAHSAAKVDRFYANVARLERMFIRAFEREDDWQERVRRPTPRVVSARGAPGDARQPEDDERGQRR